VSSIMYKWCVWHNVLLEGEKGCRKGNSWELGSTVAALGRGAARRVSCSVTPSCRSRSHAIQIRACAASLVGFAFAISHCLSFKQWQCQDTVKYVYVHPPSCPLLHTYDDRNGHRVIFNKVRRALLLNSARLITKQRNHISWVIFANPALARAQSVTLTRLCTQIEMD